MGDAYDNAMAESFVGTFKCGPAKSRTFRTRCEAEMRRSSRSGDLPPAELEQLYYPQHCFAQRELSGKVALDSLSVVGSIG